MQGEEIKKSLTQEKCLEAAHVPGSVNRTLHTNINFHF